MNREFKRRPHRIVLAFSLAMLVGIIPVGILFFLLYRFLAETPYEVHFILLTSLVWVFFITKRFQRIYPTRIFVSSEKLSIPLKKGRHASLRPGIFFIHRRLGKRFRILECELDDISSPVYLDPSSFEHSSELGRIFQVLGRNPVWQRENFDPDTIRPFLGSTFQQTFLEIPLGALYPLILSVSAVSYILWDNFWGVIAPWALVLLSPTSNPFRTYTITERGLVIKSLPVFPEKLICWESFIFGKTLRLNSRGISYTFFRFYDAEGNQVLSLNECAGYEKLSAFLKERTQTYPENIFFI